MYVIKEITLMKAGAALIILFRPVEAFYTSASCVKLINNIACTTFRMSLGFLTKDLDLRKRGIENLKKIPYNLLDITIYSLAIITPIFPVFTFYSNVKRW